MALNWEKLNKNTTAKTSNSKTSLDWSKVTNKNSTAKISSENLNTYNKLKNATQTRSYDEAVKQSQPLPFTNSSGALDPFALTKGIQQQVKYGQADALIGTEARKTMQERIDYNGYGLPAGFNKNDVEAYKILSGKTDDEVRKEVVSGLMGNNPEYDQIQKETKLINRYDSITPVANYTLGDLQLDLNKAYYDYSQNPSDYNKKKVERIEKLISMYSENAKNVGKGGIFTKDFATYLPQQVGQIEAGLRGAAVGGGAGAATGAGVGSVIPGAGTAAGALTGFKLGAKAGYVGGVTKYSYEQMQGGAYKDLIDMGVPEDVALDISKDTALWQSLIEGAGAGVDIATLGLGKLLTTPAKTATQATAKQMIKEALKAYGVNLVSEAVEEGTQEVVSIKGEKEAMKRAGFERQTTSEEDLKRVGEAAKGGAILGGIMGGGNLIGNIGTSIASTRSAQQNVIPQSPQIEQTQPSNEVIPTQVQNQNTANVVQNNANVQNNVQNQPNIEQISQNNVENAQNLQKTVQNLVDSFNGYTEKEIKNFEGGKISVARSNNDILDFVKKARTVSNNFKLYMSKVKKNVSDAIKTKFNIDIEGYNISLKNDDVRKVYKDHGTEETETPRGQVPITEEDFTLIPLIINEPDNIELVGTSPQGKPAIRFEKNINGNIVAITYVSDKHKNLELQTMYKFKNDKKIDSATALYENNAPRLNTSEMDSSTNLINNIIQSNENYVNTLPTQAEQRQKLSEKTGFMLANEGDSYKRNMFNNNAKAINDLIKAKRIVSNEFDIKIRAKQELLNSKKDKTTKVAQNLQTQIINLQKRKANTEEKFIKQIDRLENRNATINKLKKQVSEDRLPTRKEIKQDIITETDMESINLDNTKDLSKFIMNNTTPLRVNEKIFDRETAQKINDNFFRPIKTNEAERIRFLNKERSEIESLDIKPRSEESEYVQIYGEGEWVNPSTGETTPFTLDDLKKKFPENWEKIKNAAEVIRGKYDTYLDAVNKELNKMGYDSIPKLKNYFRHFEETTSLLDQIGIPSKADHLPTDLNGLTSDLRPGKNFFANALSRTGKKTTYDAITGIDGYLEGVSKLMYHTEDIQKLRTFDEYIRNKYGKNADLEGLNKQEFAEKVKQIQEGHLSEYAAWLSEYTNNLAGKKSKLDRGTEEALGRRIYGTLNAIKKQVGSNLTGLNLNSALSNFISITQGASKTSKLAMLEGLGDTLQNIFVDDGFINKSDFLTRRFGSDKLSKTTWEKMSNAGQIFMSGTDYFSANLITRSKYHEYLNKGYPENEAMKLADEFADRLMGGRALGDMPNIFNSKTLGILTQFQLENVNQFDSMFHDTKYEDRVAEQTKYEAKTWNEKLKTQLANKNPKFYNGLTATFILGQLLAYAWAYNKVDEELTGSGGAFDPIGMIEDLIKDFTNPNVSKGQAIANLSKNILDAIPYANILTGGGRVPMTDAIPNIVDLLEGESTISSELWKVANLALPTGGGQLRKTAQAAGALIKGGDYKTNANGEKQLKFPIAQEGNVAQRIAEGTQALLFGKWATPRGKEYIENGFKSLSAVETEGLEEAKKVGIDTTKYYEIRDSIKALKIPKFKDKTGKEKAVEGARKKMIKEELDSRKELTEEQKRILYNIFYKREL